MTKHAARAAPKPCAARRLTKGPKRRLAFGLVSRLASHRLRHSRAGGNPRCVAILDFRLRGNDGGLCTQAKRGRLVLSPPSDELSSTGLCGSARKRASTTDFGQLSERSERSSRSEFCPTRKDRAAQGSPRNARAEEAGVASLPTFLSIQESGSAAGPNSRRRRTSQAEATTRSGTDARRTILDSRLRGNDGKNPPDPRTSRFSPFISAQCRPQASRTIALSRS